MEYFKSFPLFIILIPFMASFSMPLVKNEKTAKTISLITSFICLALSAFTFFYVITNGAFKYDMGHFKAPLGIELKVGIFESVMVSVFMFVTFSVIAHSVCNSQNDMTSKKVPIYYLLLNVFSASICGITLTNDIFNAFVFIEVSTIAACGMIVVKDKEENILAAIKYLVYSSLGSGLVLMGIAFIYSITGNLNMDFINIELSKVYMEYDKVVMISLALFTFGIGIKGAMFPFYVWLPDAHSSSTDSTSAIISAVGLKGPVILLIKVFYTVFGAYILRQSSVLDMVLVLGATGMIMGSVFAIFQNNIKKMVAYSSVAQMGYIFLGIGLGSVAGLTASAFHIITHALTKSLLFLSVGAMIKRKNTYLIGDMSALGKNMPLTLGVFSIGVFSMVGIPILPGFITKWNLSMASIESGKGFMVAAIILSSLLNCIYYLPVVINGYFKKGAEHSYDVGIEKNVDKEKLLTMAPSLLLAGAAIAVGITSGKIIEVLTLAFENIM